MRALLARSLVLSAALVACGGAAGGHGSTSLISGRWKGAEMLNCGGNEADCFYPVVRARLTSVVTLSGPQVPESLRPVMRVHADPISTMDTILAVRREADGTWQGVTLKIVNPGEEACVSNEDFGTLRIERPWMSWRKKGETCFRTR